MGGGTVPMEYEVVQPTYTYYLMQKILAKAVAESWTTTIPSLKNKDGSINIGEIYDYDNIVMLEKTFIMGYERHDEHEAFNIGSTVFKSEVNLTIDIRSGNKNDYWTAYRLVKHAIKAMSGSGELINARGSEMKYLIEYRGSTDLSDKLKKLWRRNVEVRLYTTDGV